MFPLVRRDSVGSGGRTAIEDLSVHRATQPFREFVDLKESRMRMSTILPSGSRKHALAMAVDDEPAAAVLARISALTGRKMSWRLLYDYGLGQYALNLHFVK